MTSTHPKTAQLHWSLGKEKLNAQRDTTTDLSGWLKFIK